MAQLEIRMPQLGLIMESGTIVNWLKKEGDTVYTGEPLFEVETEKSVIEVESSAAGTLEEILVEAGDSADVGATLATLEGSPARNHEALSSEDEVATAETVPVGSSGRREENTTVEAPAPSQKRSRVRASPTARRLARQTGIDLETVHGTGPRRRIVLKDIEHAAEEPDRMTPTLPGSAVQRKALSPMRRAIARAMTESAAIPQLQVSRIVELDTVLALQRLLRPGMERTKGVRLSVADFILQASAGALDRHTQLNAHLNDSADDLEAVLHSSVNLGIAVAVDEGLLVPVLHDAETLSLMGIARARATLTEKARNGKLKESEARGATFTVSNLGAAGPDRFTALVNPPEVAILAVGRIREVPAAKSGQLSVHKVCELTLSADHRFIDGAQASEFLNDLATTLESEEWDII